MAGAAYLDGPFPHVASLEVIVLTGRPNEDGSAARGAACLEGTSSVGRPTLKAPPPHVTCLEGAASAGQRDNDGSIARGAACLEGIASTGVAYLDGSVSTRRLPRKHHLGRAAYPDYLRLMGYYRSVILRRPWAST